MTETRLEQVGVPEVKVTWTPLFIVNCEVWFPQKVRVFVMGGVAKVTTVTFTRVPLLSKIAVNCTKLTVPVATDMFGALSAPDTLKLLPQPLTNESRNRRKSCANR